jgi:predicted naringenin-chalcone synthase
MPVLARFASTRPLYSVRQTDSFAWLARAHAQAEAGVAGLGDRERDAFASKIARLLDRVACPPHKLATRGSMIGDVLRPDWSHNEVYDLLRHPHGAPTSVRTQLYGDFVDRYFADAYPADEQPPDDLVHVTCTGYTSPSGAQKLVAARGWGARTRVTHAYHMGCYAALPALRIAAGFIASAARRVDIVHTELCTLHLDPTDHRLEQLVVHSLFGDGLIRYSMLAEDGGPGLAPISACEVILADSAHAMAWLPGDHGMQMTLARDVPDRIAAAVRDLVMALYQRAGRDLAAMRDTVFAVHPGGPKILDQVGRALELSDEQLATSRAVLRDHGNMSSATLPHIWMRMLDDPGIARGTLIASLAFGPGLTACGALLEKR